MSKIFGADQWSKLQHTLVGAGFDEVVAAQIIEATRQASRLKTQAVIDVLAERDRQFSVEGITFAHDDAHVDGEISAAACCYAGAASITTHLRGNVYAGSPPFDGWTGFGWPWDSAWWKPGTARRMLVKAAALIVAEIERIDRANYSKGASHD